MRPNPRMDWLCSDENPDVASREAYRALARGQAQYPPLIRQVGTVITAAGRIIAAAATGQKIAVDMSEQKRRLAICAVCEYFDAEQTRCRKCGCFANLKARLETEHCPDLPPRW